MVCSCCCVVAQLCPTLSDPIDRSPPGSSARGISQARTLEWVAISFSRGSSDLRNLVLYFSIATVTHTHTHTHTHTTCGLKQHACMLWLQSCPTLCDPIDLLGSSVHGDFPIRILEWVAISFSIKQHGSLF